MNTAFSYTTVGLTVTFQNLSTIPSECTCYWKFGDGATGTGTYQIHRYKRCGIYTVEMYIKDKDGNEVGNSSQTILVTNMVKTHLSGSIYTLIDVYLPAELVGEIPFDTKKLFIEKWQLYLQPLVNHFIPVECYNNELYYEALENQLIMELAAYDYTVNELVNISRAMAHSIIEGNSETTTDGSQESGGGDVKKIITGPTEVEYFSGTSGDSELSNAITKATQPGGILDTLKQNICMLAGRLDIYLPLCDRPVSVVIPRVVNRRRPGPIGGPDPLELVKK